MELQAGQNVRPRCRPPLQRKGIHRRSSRYPLFLHLTTVPDPFMRENLVFSERGSRSCLDGRPSTVSFSSTPAVSMARPGGVQPASGPVSDNLPVSSLSPSVYLRTDAGQITVTDYGPAPRHRALACRSRGGASPRVASPERQREDQSESVTPFVELGPPMAFLRGMML